MLFAKRYQIDRFLARSASSVVYRAQDVTNGRYVTVKLLSGVILDQELMQRFHREAQIARTLLHPNIRAFLDHGVNADGTPYHILEYIDGQTLDDILGVVGALNPSEAVTVFIKACRALQYLHSRGVVHRDLKPENLMIPNGEGQINVKVIDFGIAKGTKSGVHQSVELTKPGEIFGSLLYAAPERLAGHPADARSDIYSLGCVLYEALTGINPFNADTAAKIAERQSRLVPDTLLRVGLHPAVALLLQPIVSKSIDKSPDRRFQTAAEMKDALERVEAPVRNACDDAEMRGAAPPKVGVMQYVALAALGLLVIAGVIVACNLIEQIKAAGLGKLLGL